MPSRNIRKEYIENGVYHVYNRGIDKRDIFQDPSDYRFFLYILKSYLLSLIEQEKLQMSKDGEILKRGFFSDKINIFAYALMPNHFHLLVKQKGERDLPEFIRAVATTYVGYFNKKYERSGPLFQGVYKAVLVQDDDYILHLSRYLHLNPFKDRSDLSKQEISKQFTSFGDYTGLRNSKWLDTDFILGYYKKEGDEQATSDLKHSYEEFVLQSETDEREYLERLTLD